MRAGGRRVDTPAGIGEPLSTVAAVRQPLAPVAAVDPTRLAITSPTCHDAATGEGSDRIMGLWRARGLLPKLPASTGHHRPAPRRGRGKDGSACHSGWPPAHSILQPLPLGHPCAPTGRRVSPPAVSAAGGASTGEICRHPPPWFGGPRASDGGSGLGEHPMLATKECAMRSTYRRWRSSREDPMPSGKS